MSLLDLAGKRGLVVGIANASSIAYGCAKAFHAAGAELAITYLNAQAEPYVRPLAQKLASPIIVLGARIPIILTSRADTVLARMASCAVALIAARRGDRAAP
jgi:enoyl-[acyl-carrier-protein] reductase (NADH)